MSRHLSPVAPPSRPHRLESRAEVERWASARRAALRGLAEQDRRAGGGGRAAELALDEGLAA